MGSVWQILKAERAPGPKGEGPVFWLWVFAGTRTLRRVSVQVDREFLVNRYFSREECKVGFFNISFSVFVF